jgi:hypothetical protein
MKQRINNNLLAVNPELAKEWHPTKNGDLTPEKVTPGSSKKVWWVCKKGHEWHPTKNGKLRPGDIRPSSGKKAWWVCEKGHEWEAVIADRNYGRGCPVCYSIKKNRRWI